MDRLWNFPPAPRRFEFAAPLESSAVPLLAGKLALPTGAFEAFADKVDCPWNCPFGPWPRFDFTVPLESPVVPMLAERLALELDSLWVVHPPHSSRPPSVSSLEDWHYRQRYLQQAVDRLHTWPSTTCSKKQNHTHHSGRRFLTQNPDNLRTTLGHLGKTSTVPQQSRGVPRRLRAKGEGLVFDAVQFRRRWGRAGRRCAPDGRPPMVAALAPAQFFSGLARLAARVPRSPAVAVWSQSDVDHQSKPEESGSRFLCLRFET